LKLASSVVLAFAKFRGISAKEIYRIAVDRDEGKG